MTNEPDTRRVVFVGDLAVDALLLEEKHRVNSPRAFIRHATSTTEWLEKLRMEANGNKVQFTPGGSIANVAASLAERRPDAEVIFCSVTRAEPSSVLSFPFWWPGYGTAAADLTARGIRVYGRDSSRKHPEVPSSIVKIARNGSVSSLFAREPRYTTPHEEPGDVLVLRSDHLRLLSGEYIASFPRLAVLVADDGSGVDEVWPYLNIAERSWLFGRRDQVEELSNNRPLGYDLTLVGTAGADGVYIVAQSESLELPVAPATFSGSELGAGDAYMGGFLSRALYDDADFEGAHQSGREQALSVLNTMGARKPVTENLNSILPVAVQRRSPSKDEGRILKEVRRSPGLAIVTGGQSGVDELATRIAAEFALPVHVVMPRGRRREASAQQIGDFDKLKRYVRVHELHSTSFRFRTWATVYAADLVVLFDYADGEGSAETRRAADYFTRPLLEYPRSTQYELRTWIDVHSPEAILLAGNRESLLRRGDCWSAAGQQIEQAIEVLLDVVRVRDTADTGSNTSEPLAVDSIPTVGPFLVPRELWYNTRLPQLLRSLGIDLKPTALKARDVAKALEIDACRVGVTWPSLLPPAELSRFRVTPLGMAAISYAFVGVEETLNDAPDGLAVQYENPYLRFATEEFHARTHRKWLISGSAETWLDTRLATSAFDTFRTGRSLSAHSLMGYWPVGWETVALVTRREES